MFYTNVSSECDFFPIKKELSRDYELTNHGSCAPVTSPRLSWKMTHDFRHNSDVKIFLVLSFDNMVNDTVVRVISVIPPVYHRWKWILCFLILLEFNTCCIV